MRSALALCLLIALYVSANATEGHYAQSRPVVVRRGPAATSSFGMIPRYGVPGGTRVFRDDTAPGGLRTYHDDPPAYDDPSKFGG